MYPSGAYEIKQHERAELHSQLLTCHFVLLVLESPMCTGFASQKKEYDKGMQGRAVDQEWHHTLFVCALDMNTTKFDSP